MENYKKVIKRRMHLAAIFNCIVVIFIALTAWYGSYLAQNGRSTFSQGFIPGFQTGGFIGLQLVVLYHIAKYRKAIKNEESLKRLYIEENDERKKLIRDKIGGTGLNFIIGSGAAAVIISGFFNESVFITLLGALIFIVMVKGFLKLYYRNKF
ncbi:MAG: hypothetical protein LIR50_08290 [Bacillota bacterium]|nr:hypothetical protein [Bacillota bacterium]